MMEPLHGGRSMTFLDRVLEPPSYGYLKDGKFYKPTQTEIGAEFFRRLNVFRDRKNWLALFCWATSLSFALPLGWFLIYHFSWPLAVAGFIYSMVILGSHGTFWFHRYGTHRAYQFRNGLVREICRNLVIRVLPEEVYIISHHVHHQISEEPGDPYNVNGGWLYCFLADVNHQGIRKDLNEKDYGQLCKLMSHSGVWLNSYAQYQKWGSLCHPARTALHFALNWAFWFGTFYLIGGIAFATAVFGSAGVWAIGVRTFNYEGHGKGKDRRQDGIDFNRRDLSVNQIWPGYVAGEWHNNHHLFPNGARSGFLPYQIDIPWYFVRFLYSIGGITTLKDYKAVFLRDYYEPYVESLKAARPAEELSISPEVL
jgi:sn-1 stearoyl-lipid 9-desaturase